MELIQNQTFDQERALYSQKDLVVENCFFDGPQDGESAFKEAKNIDVKNSYFNLRYPFWHNDVLKIQNCAMTEFCRAALWYSNKIEIFDTKMHGIKALRECSDVKIKNCSIVSPEYGWSVSNIQMQNSTCESEYFMMRSKSLNFENVTLKGKYSFQYIEDATFINCNFDTKDAFWHGKNIVVKDSTIKGEYFAWYSQNLTLINCKIIGTQPFCYCKNLTLVNCSMQNCDLAFEKSEVNAQITTKVDSIKNPLSGEIKVKAVGELIINEPYSQAKVIIE